MEKLAAGDPQLIGAYRLLARLGAGGSGQVFLARSDKGRTVAVRLIRKELADQDRFRSRFRQEVAAARRVSGRWTAPVVDADTEADVPWLATGYIAGPTLRDVISGGAGGGASGAGPSAGAGGHGPLPERSVRILAAGLAHALQDIHATGLIHRDLKPSNVLVTAGGPRVIDFGIARAVESADGGLGQPGGAMGSPGFMAPEQLSGERVTAAGDVFCLGSVLVYAATGRLPFGAAGSVAQEAANLSEVPPGLVELVRGCLFKDPAARPTTNDILAMVGDVAAAEAAAGAGSKAGAGGKAGAEPWLPAGLLAQLGDHTTQLLTRKVPASQAKALGPGAAAAKTAAPADAPTAAPTADTMTLRAVPAPPKQPRTPRALPAGQAGPGEQAGRPGRAPRPTIAPDQAQTPAPVQAQEPSRTQAQAPTPAQIPAPGTGPAQAPPRGPAQGTPPQGPTSGAPAYGYPYPAPGPAPAYGYPQPGYGYPQPGYGGAPALYGQTPPPYGQTPPPGSPSPYGQPPLPEPSEPRRSRGTIALIVVAAIVAIGAGGLVYAFMGSDGTKDDKATRASSDATPKPPAEDEVPPASSPSPSPSASPSEEQGAVPSDYLGTWTGSVDTAQGSSTRQLVIKQGDVGETVLSLTADGPPSGGGTSYHCVFEAPLTSVPAPGTPLEIGPSTVTTGEPMSSCTPGTPTRLTILDNGNSLRRVTTSGEALTYTRSD
ncbi:protein kinase [Streptomyces sp. NPDC088725]|uniref:protein kinase domain-containing protein n=1 Tax=Streptomyces sp. NPDC088725 TaxID=3365873 RepID=UPI0037FF8DB0